MAHDVFISYATDDRQVAEKVCAALEADNIKCWIAPRDVPFGADYEEAIVDGIASSRIIVLVLSSHSNASPHVKREIQNACSDDSGKQIVPLRIEDIEYNKALRYYLGSAQWLDASTPPLEQHLGRLVEHVRSHLSRAGDAPRSEQPTPHSNMERTPLYTPTTDAAAGRRSSPAIWIVAGAVALVGILIAVFALRGGRGGETNTPPVNVNVNNASPTPQRTPAPTPTPNASPTPSPRQPLRNVNLSRNLNLRRVR